MESSKNNIQVNECSGFAERNVKEKNWFVAFEDRYPIGRIKKQRRLIYFFLPNPSYKPVCEDYFFNYHIKVIKFLLLMHLWQQHNYTLI